MSTNTATTPPATASLSRRGFFMKLGILFNGFAAIVLALPIGRFLFSSITRGRGNSYLSWVPLGNVSNFPEGETRMATFRNPLVMPTDGKTVDTACWVRRIAGRSISGVCDQLCTSRVPRPLVRAIWSFYVSLSRWRLLPRWLHERPGHQSGDSSNIRTRSKMVCSQLRPDSCQPQATRWQA